jgi:hypothetical protein
VAGDGGRAPRQRSGGGQWQLAWSSTSTPARTRKLSASLRGACLFQQRFAPRPVLPPAGMILDCSPARPGPLGYNSRLDANLSNRTHPVLLTCRRAAPVLFEPGLLDSSQIPKVLLKQLRVRASFVHDRLASRVSVSRPMELVSQLSWATWLV